MSAQRFALIIGLGIAISLTGTQAQNVVSSAPASAWEPEPGALPDTRAGACVAAYIAAFNAGEQAMRDFESRWRSEDALKERSIDARVESYRSLKERYGTIRAHSVMDDGNEDRLGVLIQTAPEQRWLACDFQFDAPGRLKAIAIDGPVDSEEIRQRLEPVDAETRDQTITAALHALNTTYVFPDVAKKIEETLTAQAAAGKYAKISSPTRFAQTLTEDLRAVCHDKHLRVRLAPPSEGGGGPPQPRNPASDAALNYGFEKAEMLEGKIGYIKLNGFDASNEARKSAAAAMAAVSGCEALIFDLRENGGGSPRMVEFLGGYLYEEPTVLNVFFDRNGKQVGQTRTLAEVPGKKLDKSLPVYVLTSGRTFSCAEEFSYDLQCSKRGVIVGETTGGGAHPVMSRALNDRFVIIVPFKRAENPISKKNWEGTGVEPDIKVPAADALEAACKDARARRAGR